MDRKEQADTSRRDFLRLAAAGAPAVVAVAASGSTAAAAEVAATAEGLRESAQVLAYYESARF